MIIVVVDLTTLRRTRHQTVNVNETQKGNPTDISRTAVASGEVLSRIRPLEGLSGLS